MLLECRNCGAPLDVRGTPKVVRCTYCGASAAMTALRTLEPQTPAGWQHPTQWQPPAQFPADSSKTLSYSRSLGAVPIVTGVFVLGLVGAGFAFALGPSNAHRPGSDGTCPASFGVPSDADVTCTCGADTIRGSVWGTGTYTLDSSPCAAARHAGAVGPQGGQVTMFSALGCASYQGSSSNGIVSSSWGSYQASFYFEGNGDGSCGRASSSGSCPATFAEAARTGVSEVRCKCGPGPVSARVWGSGPYTADSNICLAALHAGVIDRTGGDVLVKPSPGCASYSGSSYNGVTTEKWGSYQGSFHFDGHGNSDCPN